eukprot:scaffold119962_cov81-Attheya_sp.AAC.6
MARRSPRLQYSRINTLAHNDPLTASCAVMSTPAQSPTYQSAYQSKLSGIYVILYIVEDICVLHQIQTSSILTIECDNKKCLWTAIDKKGTVSPKASSFDLLLAIRNKIWQLLISVHSHWVRGLQDNWVRHQSRS